MLALLWLSLALAGPRVAVTDIVNRTGDVAFDGAGAGLSGVLLSKLVLVDDMEVVERAQLSAVLGEIALGKGGALDLTTAAKAGKLVGASHLVMGELVSVKLPTIAVNLRVVEVSTGKVIAATDVVGEVGERGEEFFVLVDQAAFGIVDALQVKLGAKDRIELGQVAVKHFDTIQTYGRALAALDRGDAATAQSQLGKALAMEPGFRLAEQALARIATESAAARRGYAHAAITAAHKAWEELEPRVAGALPPNPSTADLARAAVRARLRLVRGDLEGYLVMEDARVKGTTAAHCKASGEFHTVARDTATDAYTRSRVLNELSVWPWEVRTQMAEVLMLLGRREAAWTMIHDTYQHPGPTLSPRSGPRLPLHWAESHGYTDLAVLARRQALHHAQLLGHDEDARRALDELDDALEDATEAREARTQWETFQSRYKLPKADPKQLNDEEYAVQGIVAVDPALRLAGYRAFHARVGSGYYQGVQNESDFRDLAQRWRSAAERAWSEQWYADQRLAVLLDYHAAVPARDEEERSRRVKELDEFASRAYAQ